VVSAESVIVSFSKLVAGSVPEMNSRGSTSSFNIVVASSFGCAVSLSLCLWLMFVISSRTGEMPGSVCSCLFGTYHGALSIVRSILFWNLCRISILDVLADPHNGAL
jgi:hypothetical protein